MPRFYVLLAFLVALLMACGGPSSLNNNTNSTPSKGSLEISISGLPSGLQANLALEGPNFARALSLSQKQKLDNLEVGSYTLSATAFSDSSNTYTPVTARQTATVNGGKTTSVQVVFSSSPIAPTTGSLSLTISGLPSGVAALVNLSGPAGFSRSLNASQMLTALAPGNYTLTAQNVQVSGSTYTPTASSQALTISAGNTANANITYQLPSTPTGGYKVVIRFVGSVTASQQAAFNRAATRWAQIITQSLGALTVNIAANRCLNGTPAFSGELRDVLIDATITAIDGANGILGQAGPCLMRPGSGLTAYGVMEFDSADMAELEADGQLDQVILHEMGHVLGIGTLWNSGGRSLLQGEGGSDPRFVGSNAVREWQALGGTGNVPVENTGNPGTRDGHWRESIFVHELMTGYLNPGLNPISRLTIGSLQDLGYGVSYSASESYSLPVGVTSLHTHSHFDHSRIIHVEPQGYVN